MKREIQAELDNKISHTATFSEVDGSAFYHDQRIENSPRSPQNSNYLGLLNSSKRENKTSTSREVVIEEPVYGAYEPTFKSSFLEEDEDARIPRKDSWESINVSSKNRAFNRAVNASYITPSKSEGLNRQNHKSVYVSQNDAAVDARSTKDTGDKKTTPKKVMVS